MTRRSLSIAVAAGLGIVLGGSIAFGQDVRAGWSLDVTKPKQAILSYAPEDKGPRLLIVACLRDTEEFGMYSTGMMAGVTPHGGILTMQLVSGGMKYTVRGEPGIDNATKEAAFSYETNIDARALGLVRTELMPLLQSKGPLVVTIGRQERKLPLTGIAEPLRKFSAVCFGR
jgi:hypothetical protein